MKKYETDQAPAAVAAYTQGIETSNRLLFTSGQVALTPEGRLITDSIEAETRQVLHNLRAILGAAALDFYHVVKSNVYLTDPEYFGPVNAVYAEAFAGREFPPTRECVIVKDLPLPNARVEISMIAEFPKR